MNLLYEKVIHKSLGDGKIIGFDGNNIEVQFASKISKFVYPRRFETLEQLQLELLDYVHWFNNIRLHGTLGYLSPVEFKKSRTL